MMNIFKNILAVGLASVLALTIPLGLTKNSANDSNLKFNDDGKFKILMISDAQDTDSPQKDTIALIESAITSEKPDLVIFNGDNTNGKWLGVNEKKTIKAIDNIISPIEKSGVPFAIVFGNHDEEGGVSKEKQMEIYQGYKGCLAVEGEDMTGCGTYNLLIKDHKNEKNIFNIWLIDSGDYAVEGGYAYVASDQIAWYERESNKLKEANGGVVLPSILFQHIAVPEVYKLFNEVTKETEGAVKGKSCYTDKYFVASDKITQGALREGVCSPNINNGQFDSWKKQGDIVGAFFGHDHTNDFSGKLDNIVLTNCLSTGFYSYGNVHGIRTIELDENDLTTFKSESKHFENVVGRSPSNSLIGNLGFYIFGLMVLAVVVFVIVIALIVVGIILIIKHKRKKTMLKNKT